MQKTKPHIDNYASIQTINIKQRQKSNGQTRRASESDEKQIKERPLKSKKRGREKAQTNSEELKQGVKQQRAKCKNNDKRV